jgi:glycosyltransferase involved in cell wall biosynthesis
LDIPFRYVLYPGNHRRYKNLERLIRAFALSRLPRENIHLAITGPTNQYLAAVAQSVGVGPSVVFLGAIPKIDMPKLYKGALAICFVSLYEGFGLPIVEGFASGVPVVAARSSALPEVAGNAALLVDPFDIGGIASALESATMDETERSRLKAAGLFRAGQFWELVLQTALS